MNILIAKFYYFEVIIMRYIYLQVNSYLNKFDSWKNAKGISRILDVKQYKITE